jgi:divinyl chlorophyllide a 8-vinyl-reductase
MIDQTPLPRPVSAAAAQKKRVFMLGATGTIGQATARALVARGHEVICFIRPRAGVGGRLTPEDSALRLPGASLRYGEVTDPASLQCDGFCGEHFDALVSCLASRTGAPKDAWAIDHQAHLNALVAAKEAGATQMVLLSAICVQKPLLAFGAFLFHRARHGILQIARRPDRAGEKRQALSDVRRRHVDCLQTDQR